MTVQKILKEYFSANEIFEENQLIFFSISGSLLAYLQWIYITSCFPSKNINVVKIMCSCFLICFDHFIIKEVIYIAFELKADRATNLSLIVAMVALIVRKTNTVWLQFIGHFWTLISRKQTEKCRSYYPSKRVSFFPNKETIWTLTNFESRLIWPQPLATIDSQ